MVLDLNGNPEMNADDVNLDDFSDKEIYKLQCKISERHTSDYENEKYAVRALAIKINDENPDLRELFKGIEGLKNGFRMSTEVELDVDFSYGWSLISDGEDDNTWEVHPVINIHDYDKIREKVFNNFSELALKFKEIAAKYDLDSLGRFDGRNEILEEIFCIWDPPRRDRGWLAS